MPRLNTDRHATSTQKKKIMPKYIILRSHAQHAVVYQNDFDWYDLVAAQSWRAMMHEIQQAVVEKQYGAHECPNGIRFSYRRRRTWSRQNGLNRERMVWDGEYREVQTC
eukprot:TRINITY_DN4589_c0_g1_i1.p2 TRINITY_DN4589_c0_g1~~TRINITY_DN4589_c0_g1_i1.p2  ORF type:complete len:109 (+),score=5.68 TRINITY_DN4589_c0_g1_i1:263-589(+)